MRICKEKRVPKPCFINAWENDFETDPFVLITNQIIAELKPEKDDIEKLKKIGKSILKAIIPKATTYIPLAFGAPPLCGKFKDVTDDALTLLTDNLFDGLESREKEQSVVQQFADSLEKIMKGEKLIIFIDELDRCRPSFAIETLERIKHLFNIEGIIFILSTNVKQLSHGVSGVYGENFDGRKYLERFIDFSYHLKEPSNALYWELLTKSDDHNAKLEPLMEHGQYLASHFELTIREINKLFFRLKLTLLADRSQMSKTLILLMLFIHNDSEESYQRFCSNDTKIIDELTKQFDFYRINIPVEDGGICINQHPFKQSIIELWSLLLSKESTIENTREPWNGDVNTRVKLDQIIADADLEGGREIRGLEILNPNPFDYDSFSEYQKVIFLFAEFYTDLGGFNAQGGEKSSIKIENSKLADNE